MSQLYKHSDKSTDIKNVRTNTMTLGKHSVQLVRVTRPIGKKPTGFENSVCHGHQFVCFTQEMENVS